MTPGSPSPRRLRHEQADVVPVPGGRLLRVRDVAERLAVSTRCIQTWVALGRLHPIRLTPRTLRIAEAEVEALIREARKVPPGPPGGGRLT